MEAFKPVLFSLVKEEGRTGVELSFSLLFLAVPDGLSLADSSSPGNPSDCHQKLPFVESSLVTFCCEHFCVSLAICENLLSHFSPPQGATKVPSLSCRMKTAVSS